MVSEYNKHIYNDNLVILHGLVMTDAISPLWKSSQEVISYIQPIIDMFSSHPLAIYATLNYVDYHVRCHNVIGIITFDQPLWWKVLSIILSMVQNSILRLNTFHMQMSFPAA